MTISVQLNGHIGFIERCINVMMYMDLSGVNSVGQPIANIQIQYLYVLAGFNWIANISATTLDKALTCEGIPG